MKLQKARKQAKSEKKRMGHPMDECQMGDTSSCPKTGYHCKEGSNPFVKNTCHENVTCVKQGCSDTKICLTDSICHDKATNKLIGETCNGQHTHCLSGCCDSNDDTCVHCEN